MPTVLVVDDNPADRELIERMLTPQFRVWDATDCASGLAVFRREHPDCVLLDHHMPGGDGLDGLIELVKEQAVVIMISSSSDEDIAAEAIRRGARDFIPKGSITPLVLRRMILREHERRVLEQELRLAHKLEAIGQLAAGVAHEINTPAQYVSDNLTFLAEGFRDILPLLEACVDIGRGESTDLETLRRLVRKTDVAFLTAELPSVLQQSASGIAQIKKIVQAMKTFSHPSDEMELIDLNAAIETTVTVAKNEWKYVANVQLDLEPKLPGVTCHPSEINQVFLNLIVNAAHAIEDVVGRGGTSKGTIAISTRVDGDHVAIDVADTGCGIPSDIRERIFDPFFTTKGIGKGTGQGLAIAHRIVCEHHAGTIDFVSAVGKGTRFSIKLPIARVEHPSTRETRAA